MKPQLLIACDFDGTVTQQDTLVEILDRYGAPDWRQIQDQVVSGALSIREGLAQEMATVNADATSLKTLLANQINIDPTFLSFFKLMQLKGIPVILLTGGFDFCVETVLDRQPMGPIPYLSNRLIPTDHAGSQNNWQIEFPFPSERCQDCGYCKADPILDWKDQGYTTIFIGNGVTDRCPTQVADLAFAKDELLSWSQSEGVPALAFTTFNDVEQEMRSREWI